MSVRVLTAIKRVLCVAMCMAVAIAGNAVASDIYKWTDDAGNVHYGDRPAEDTETERLDIKSRPTVRTQLASITKPANDLRRQAPLVSPSADDTDKAPQPQGPTPEELRAEAAERAEQCTKYKERLQTFLQSRRLYRQDASGEREYLSEDEMRTARDETQDKVEEYCSP